MMAQKHLHELLKEDQEPFHLGRYVADRRFKLRGTIARPKKRNPIINNSSSANHSLCPQACFFSFNGSPDVGNSPLPEFLSPVSKTHCRSPNDTVFLHVPAATATLLVEAATRIQKKPSFDKGFGLFGFILKRLKNQTQKTRKGELCDNSVKEEVRPDSQFGNENIPRKSDKVKEILLSSEETVSSHICNNGRFSSAWWSESNEEKSLDMETSTSCCSEDSENTEVTLAVTANGSSVSRDKHLSSSPFRFSLPKSPSVHPTPDLLSPAGSPIFHTKEDEENCEAETPEKIQLEGKEEKDQCSPVSVLETSFTVDDNGDELRNEYRDDSNVECSYALLQKAKQKLLNKLSRFEKLAELDPLELENTMWEDQDNECENGFQDLEDEGIMSPDGEETIVDELTEEWFFQTEGLGQLRKASTVDMRRLLSDLLAEKRRVSSLSDNREMMSLERVYKRLHSWKEAENITDAIVESDFKEEFEGWKKYKDQVTEMAMQIEGAVFWFLVDEFSEELDQSVGIHPQDCKLNIEMHDPTRTM